MKRRAYAKRRDANEPEIVRDLERVGASVKRMEDDDLLVGWQGRNFILEVKIPGGRIKPSQKDMQATWRGQYAIVYSSDEALRTIGAIT